MKPIAAVTPPVLVRVRCLRCGEESRPDEPEFTGLPVYPAGRWMRRAGKWFHLHAYESLHPAVEVREHELAAAA